MGDFPSKLMAALLAVHGMLGCCWHHDHCRAEAPCAARESAESLNGGADEHSSPAGESSHNNDSDRHERRLCRGSACVFIGSRKAVLAELVHPLGKMPFAIASLGNPLECNLPGGYSYFPPDAFMPPLRLHLVHQLLLI